MSSEEFTRGGGVAHSRGLFRAINHTIGNVSMTTRRVPRTTIGPLDAATAALVRLSAAITAGTEAVVRRSLARCIEEGAPDRWVEELVLQSYLFAGFPRALNVAREWRRATGAAPAPGRASEGYADVYQWRLRGAETCAIVYGRNYDKLRTNIRALHPSLDEWMIVEGYGKVLAREGLDLPRRELCIIAACAAAGQDRQLQSHLHGALNAGATLESVSGTLAALRGVVPAARLRRAQRLWGRVKRTA